MSEALRDLAHCIVMHLDGCAAAWPGMDPEIQHLNRAVRSAAVRREFNTAAKGLYDIMLASAIAIGLHPLAWDYQYPPHPSAQDLAERIGFAELIGPDGPMDAPQSRVGFTLMAADTFYPLHAHPATELYLVIAGNAQWTASDRHRQVPPGGFVLHRSNEPHAMRTLTEPLLALYSWSGDLDTAAFYL
jgi:mannose-6-phosphate isomerase-like protein (cupin superfamily)